MSVRFFTANVKYTGSPSMTSFLSNVTLAVRPIVSSFAFGTGAFFFGTGTGSAIAGNQPRNSAS